MASTIATTGADQITANAEEGGGQMGWAKNKAKLVDNAIYIIAVVAIDSQYPSENKGRAAAASAKTPPPPMIMISVFIVNMTPTEASSVMKVEISVPPTRGYATDCRGN